MKDSIVEEGLGVKIFSYFSAVKFSLFIMIVSILLAVFESNTKAFLVASGDIVIYLLLLVPLSWLIVRKKIGNQYTKYFLPIIAVLIIDVFYYSNGFVLSFLPLIIFVMLVILYMTSMHEVAYLYQTLIPRFHIPFKFVTYIKAFSLNLVSLDNHRTLYMRIGIALLITIPFLGAFLALFMSADVHFSAAVKSLFSFRPDFSFGTLVSIPLYFIGYLLLFIYGFSNAMKRVDIKESVAFDSMIVGIFLGMLNILFVTFLFFQVSYFFGGEAYIKASGINIAEYAREGFFQLMWVMSIVVLIVLGIMRRFKGEKVIIFLMGGLILQTIVMGFSSLKKMYLYQEIKGATVLRYYVEWSDYFLLFILGLGLYYVVRKYSFHALLNTIMITGLLMLAVVSSINVDAMVASHNIEKFKNNPNHLDKAYLETLSVDALPAIQNTDIKITLYKVRDCAAFDEYHFGYCQKLKQYGAEHIQIQKGERYER